MLTSNNALSYGFACAQMAELVDALGSGPSGGNTVQVRVLFWATLLVGFDTNLHSRALVSSRI